MRELTKAESLQVGGAGGGGGGSSTTTPMVAPEFKPLVNLYTQQAQQLAATPWQAYTGDRYADLNTTQNLGIGMVQDRALNGSGVFNTGENYLQGLFGQSSPGATQNPYGNVTAGANTSMVDPGVNSSRLTPGMNTDRVDAGWNNSAVSAGQNAYAGSNPYLQQNIDAALGDVTRAYRNTVMPQQTGAMVGSGSFGNSGLEQVRSEQERQLSAQLGDIASSMRMQDYTQQQQLAESALNRDMNAQQFNAGLNDTNLNRAFQAQQFNSGITDANIGRDMTAQQFNSGVVDSNLSRSMQAQQFNSGVTDANLGRDLTAQQFNATQGADWANRNDSMLQNWRSQNLQALGMVPTFANQQYTDAGQLLNAGGLQQQQVQNNLDFGYQQYQDAQNDPYKKLQTIGGVVGQNMGSQTVQSGGGK